MEDLKPKIHTASNTTILDIALLDRFSSVQGPYIKTAYNIIWNRDNAKGELDSLQEKWMKYAAGWNSKDNDAYIISEWISTLNRQISTV